MRIDSRQLDADATHRLLKGCVAPRPIAWVSTVGNNGVYNAAPFSCFTFVALEPPMIAISFERRPGGGNGGSDGKKDTLINIEATGEFVVNVVPERLATAMNASAADFPPDVSEFEKVGVTPVPGETVKAPRIAESPISMECRVVSIHELGRSKHSLVIGAVTMFHIADELYRDGEIDVLKLRPLARLSGDQYARVGEVFELGRPWLKRK